MSSIHPLIPVKQTDGTTTAAALREATRRVSSAALVSGTDTTSKEIHVVPAEGRSLEKAGDAGDALGAGGAGDVKITGSAGATRLLQPEWPLPSSSLRAASPRNPDCVCVPHPGSTAIHRKFNSGAGAVWSRGLVPRQWGAPPAPPPAHLVTAPRALHFAKFVAGRTYTRDMRAVNLGTAELRVRLHVTLEAAAAGWLSAQWTAGGGCMRVPGGAYRCVRITFRPSRPHVLHAELTLQTHEGAACRVPVCAEPRADLLHVSLLEESEAATSEEAFRPIPAALPQTDVWLALGPVLLGAILRRKLQLLTEHRDVTYIIFATDEGDYFDVQWMLGHSPRGWVRAGEFALAPRVVHGRQGGTSLHVGGGQQGGASVRVRAEAVGATRGTMRMSARGGVMRVLHLHAYALHYHPRHVTIETKEEDFGVLEAGSDAVSYYLLLRAATPDVPRGHFWLVNNSCLWYRWHWVLCSEHLHVSALLCPSVGATPPHSRTRLDLALPPSAHEPRDMRLILEHIPRVSFPLNFAPDIEYTTFEPADESGLLGGWTCGVRAGTIRTRAVVTPRRALLLPPAIALHHSFRLCVLPLQFRCVLVRSAEDDYTRMNGVPALESRLVMLMLRHEPCACLPLPCICEPTLQPSTCDKPALDHVTVCWRGGQACCARVCRRTSVRSPRLVPARSPRPAHACYPPYSCPHSCPPCLQCLNVLPALLPGENTATTLHLYNDTNERVECLLDLHWVSRSVAQCEAQGGEYSLSTRTLGNTHTPRDPNTPRDPYTPRDPHPPTPPLQPPCSRTCHAGARCECRCLLPRSQHLEPDAFSSLLVSFAAPPKDGNRLALVWSRRADIVHNAPVWHRATLLSACTVTPSLSLRVRALTDGDTARSVCEAGWRRTARGSVRAGAALTFTLRVYNAAPTGTTLRIDSYTDDDEFMKITFEPSEIDIKGFRKSDIRMTVHGLRACVRRVRVCRVRARTVAVPLYLIVDMDVTGVEVTYEIPMGNGPRSDLVILRRFEKESSALWAAEWARGLMAPPACFYRDEQLAQTQQYGGTGDASPPPCLCVTPARGVCVCVQRARRHSTLQFRNVPLHTKAVRRLCFYVRGHAGAATAKWRADLDVLPAPPSDHTQLLHKGEWGLPGAWLWVTSEEFFNGDVTRVELTLHFQAHCWGVYRDYLAIQVVGVEPLVVSVWCEAVGAPARMLAAAPPPSPPRVHPSPSCTDSNPTPPETYTIPEHVTGSLDEPYILRINLGEGSRLLRLKNDSPATLRVQVFVMQAYKVDEDCLKPTTPRPFRLLSRLVPASLPSSCDCGEQATCHSLGSAATWTGDPLLPRDPPPPPPPQHEVDVFLELGPDLGHQGDLRYQVEPSAAILSGYGISDFSMIENPDTECETDTIIFIHVMPEQEHGEWWSRPAPPPLLSRVPILASCTPANLPALCAAPQDLCLAADALTLSMDKPNIISGSVFVRSLCRVIGSVRVSPSPPWRLRAPAKAPTPTLPLLLPAHASLLVEVECVVEAGAVWTAEEERRRGGEEEGGTLRALRDGLLCFCDECGDEILSVPLSLSLHFPALVVSPERLALNPTVQHAEGYFTITHTCKLPLQVSCSVKGNELFSVEPRTMLLDPGATGVLYVKFSCAWSASLPAAAGSGSGSLGAADYTHTCSCVSVTRTQTQTQTCSVYVCGAEAQRPTPAGSSEARVQELHTPLSGQQHACRVVVQTRGRGGVVRRVHRLVTAECSRDRAAAADETYAHYYTEP